MGIYDMYGDSVGHFEPGQSSQSGGHDIITVVNLCQSLGVWPTEGTVCMCVVE